MQNYFNLQTNWFFFFYLNNITYCKTQNWFEAFKEDLHKMIKHSQQLDKEKRKLIYLFNFTLKERKKDIK